MRSLKKERGSGRLGAFASGAGRSSQHSGGVDVLEAPKPVGDPTINGSPEAPDTSPAVAETDHYRDSAPPGRRRGYQKVLAILAVVALFAAGLTGWLVAKHQNAVAAAWQHRDITAMARNQSLSSTLLQARSSITTLNDRITQNNAQLSTVRSSEGTLTSEVSTMTTRVATLHGTLTELQSHLATVGTQKEKALDQENLLTQILSGAASVWTSLQTCAEDSDTFNTELLNDVADGTFRSDPSLTRNGDTVNDECATAATRDQRLQNSIAAGIGS